MAIAYISNGLVSILKQALQLYTIGTRSRVRLSHVDVLPRVTHDAQPLHQPHTGMPTKLRWHGSKINIVLQDPFVSTSWSEYCTRRPKTAFQFQTAGSLSHLCQLEGPGSQSSIATSTPSLAPSAATLSLRCFSVRVVAVRLDNRVRVRCCQCQW